MNRLDGRYTRNLSNILNGWRMETDNYYRTRRSGKRSMRTKENHRRANDAIALHRSGLATVTGRTGYDIHRNEIIARARSRSELSENSGDDEDVCAICLSEFTPNRRRAHLPCGHRFHEECVRRWIRRSLTCPVCRSRL